MPRYEFVEGSSSKFWEIELNGSEVTTKWGRIGGSESFKTKDFGSDEKAQKEHDKLVKEKTGKGYAIVDGGKKAKAAPAKAAPTKAAKKAAKDDDDEDEEAAPAKGAGKGKAGKAAKGAAGSEPRNPDLEAAILADPDDDSNFAVYGDWLSEQGHPRGELVTAQLGNNSAVAKKLLANKELWGGMLEIKDVVTNVVWKGGFIERARVANTHDRDSEFGDGEKEEVEIPKVIGQLLDGPGRFLRELTVGIVTFMDNSYTQVAAEIAKRKSIPTLRSLWLGDFSSEETELNWSEIGSIEKMYAALPNLKKLKLRSGSMKLGKIELPSLKDLTIISGGMDKASVTSIGVAKWPNLEKLDLMLGEENYGKAGVAPLQPILDAKSVPKLKRLGIRNFAFHKELVPAVLKSKVLRQLEVLDLSLGTMGDEQADLFVAAKAQLAHLKELNVAVNYFTAAGLKKLKTLGIPITAKAASRDGFYDTNGLGQRDGDGEGDDDRYVALYE